ncbi:efflux RND transporter permease subunit [Hydrogenobacter hydrogenophilus]|uniref:Cobalt-zinc-cadmium resistance protein CzcA n=1 Tax=Hydrogenobacter hydrogenophilus TaxID=35835 RepID=A0A285P406_9AQUI|nr:CusA/CzcA family heavy metal efflux RND transporter [Hydrogenobacter hydrogenophilus]SNZ14601.1 cobalt-zinc-cadmium resistance protein CzcA [Hydrogenobacter hydrogenophilus]
MTKILSYRLLVLVLLLLSVGVGLWSFLKLPIDTFPDPTPVQVVIYTETPGLSAEETEVLVTRPIEAVLSGIKDVETVRSVSLPGLSYVTAFFKDGTDVYFARNLVAQKLPEAQAQIPSGYVPRMGPNTSGLGNVLFYALEDTKGNYSLEDLKTLQMWKVKPLIKAVDGVEEVSQWGPERAYVIKVNQDAMVLYGITWQDIINSLEEYNQIAGGGFLITPQGDVVVRGLGRIRSIQDIENIPVKKSEGISVSLGQIAQVVPSELPNRRGAFTLNGKEVQGNIVLKRINTNTMELVQDLRKKLQEVQKILPDGVKVDILYDQAYLTKKALSTVEKALVEGIVLVSIAISLYLWNIRTALLVVLSVPLTILYTFIFMKQAGISGNLMSLGGLAIGVGLFADATVVVVENIYKHLSERKDGHKVSIIADSVREVMRPVVFAIGIIITVFLPIFSLQSVEGKYYKPLATTIIFALLSSLVVAFLFMPVLSYYLLKPGKEETYLFRKIREGYIKLLERAFKIRWVLIGTTLVGFVISAFLVSRTGTEFAPELEEGALLVKSFLDPNISLEESKRVARLVESTALEYPEVVRAFSNIGRAEVGEPEDVSYIETFIILKPISEWKSFKSREEFVNLLREKLKDVPGVEFSFTQPIQMRIDELLSGVKSTVAIKVFGDDLEKINQIASQIEQVVKSTKGAVDVETEAQSGKLQLRIIPKPEELKRYQLTTSDLMNLISYALGGKEVGYLQQDTILFPIVLSLKDRNLESLKNLPLLLKDGSIVILSQVADLEIGQGFQKIRRENGMRFALVQSNLSGRDLGSFVKELKGRISKEIKLPPGYFVAFGGQFENQERAMKRLSVVVPLSVLLIFLLLYLNYNSFRDALIVLLNVPFAVIGGVFALHLSGYNLSVPATIGFIAVFGIATLNGVVLISYIRSLLENGYSLRDAVLTGASRRLRPILITATASSLGLLPMLFTKDIGSEIQKPLAVVVIGGIFTSTLLTLLILPLVYEKYGKITPNK